MPEGEYELTIVKVLEESVGENRKNKGATMWRITYDVGDTKRKVFDNLVFVKESFWRISNWWRALGFKVVPKEDIDTGEAEDHLGSTLKAFLEITEYNGEKQNNVAYYIEPKPGDMPAGAMVPVKKSEPDDIPF